MSGVPVRNRPASGAYAIDKVIRLNGEAFSDAQPWRPHVSGAVTDEHFEAPVVAGRQINTAIVYFDFFARLEVVVHDHAAVAADQRSAQFDRRQPVDVEVRKQIPLKEAGQVCGVG